jgi:hypothetical protein
LQVRIDLLDESDWGERLRNLMNAIAIMVEAEMSRFPDNVGHVLGSRRLRSYQSLAGRLTYLGVEGTRCPDRRSGLLQKTSHPA